jgi:hypothetical protein
MPRSMAPPPSGEFLVRLQKPFNGTATHTIDITGEPNRSANIKQTHHHGNTIEEKVGTMASYVPYQAFDTHEHATDNVH